MTTSGVTAWEMTARDHIIAALRDARVIPSGDDPTADELEDCVLRLNGLLKTWSAQGNLFRNDETTVTITAGNPLVTLPDGVRDISGVRLVVSATNDRTLYPWTRSDYLMLPNKATVGSPTVYYLNRTVGAPELSVWPVPATNMTLKLDYSRVADTITNATETLDIPQEWQEAVWKNLAVECAELFGAQLSERYIARAQYLYQLFLDHDRPDFYMFVADSSYC